MAEEGQAIPEGATVLKNFLTRGAVAEDENGNASVVLEVNDMTDGPQIFMVFEPHVARGLAKQLEEFASLAEES